MKRSRQANLLAGICQPPSPMASSAASSASSRNSSVRVTAGGVQNPATGFGPGNRPGGTRIETLQTSSNLRGPSRFGVLVHLRIEALNQLPGECRALFGGQLQRLGQQSLGIHVPRIARSGPSMMSGEPFRRSAPFGLTSAIPGQRRTQGIRPLHFSLEKESDVWYLYCYMYSLRSGSPGQGTCSQSQARLAPRGRKSGRRNANGDGWWLETLLPRGNRPGVGKAGKKGKGSLMKLPNKPK